MTIQIENNAVHQNNLLEEESVAPIVKKMWSIGGGKGGTGKSFITLSLGTQLANMNKRVVIIDADLGGANMHILLGIRTPEHTLNNFLKKEVNDLNQVSVKTPIPNLKLISGGDDILQLANPKFSQKERILRNLKKLDADYILLDLGAGTSFNCLDFFLYTPGKIVVVSPFPTSVQNAYGFVKSAVYRKLYRLFSGNNEIIHMINMLADPRSEEKINSISELIATVDTIDRESASLIQQEIEGFKIKLFVNMTKSNDDIKVGEILKIVVDKYLCVDVDVLRSVPFDPRVEKSILLTNHLMLNESGSAIGMPIYEIVQNMLKTDRL